MTPSKYWPVSDFHDNTTRVLGGNISGFATGGEAQPVIDGILKLQLNPHQVSYRVVEYANLAAFYENGVKM